MTNNEHKPEILTKREIELIKSLNVGKLGDAMAASNFCWAKTKRDAYVEGFRYARNNLQNQKSDLLNK